VVTRGIRNERGDIDGLLTYLGVDDKLFATTNNITASVILLFVEFLELQFLLIIVDGTDHDDQSDSDKNGDTFNPFDLWFSTAFRGTTGTGVSMRFDTDGLIDTKSERDNGGNTQNDLHAQEVSASG
jgi:hypothetical protein